MIIYYVKNTSKNSVYLPFSETEKVFLNREKAIEQYKEWSPKNGFGWFGDESIANSIGTRSMSKAGDEGAEITMMEVIE
jgi:hypothetical protein